ncbi:MAG: SAVED domain-containing protein, partial [Planctomycetia bacterium]|nr:SAVED domain-containing protein [Planctomycetia bacterium]
MVPTAYDPVTLNHWLWFKYQCHECTPTEFQRLFENIIKRARPEFIQLRAYGNIGDRKCDGLFHAEGTVFQVYSPDELKQADLQAKIETDCDGAVQHWQATLKKWVFVYNARHGLPPDIPATLDKQRQKHPTLTIDHLSSDGLWELARGLTLQQRAEVLGAPAGYEHLFFAASAAGKDVDQAVEEGQCVLVQDLMSPVNLRDVAKALAPGRPFGAPLWIRPAVGTLPWTAAATEQLAILEEALRYGRDVLPRFTVFSLAPIPLAMHLGFVLSDRVEVACYQYDRERKTWCWPDYGTDADLDFQVTGVPARRVNKSGDVVIRVSLSATIAPEETRAVATGIVEIDVLVRKPDVMWLRSPAQLSTLGTRFRDVLRGIRDHVPGCRRIHLFYAGPTGGAVVIGQQINPRMNPPLETYEYSRQSSPRYRHALTLQDPPSGPDADPPA